MDEHTQQAVADEADDQTDKPIEPDQEAEGARDQGEDDWDTLLAKFSLPKDEDQASAQNAPTQRQHDLSQAALQRLEALEARIANAEFEKDIRAVATEIRGDLPDDMFDDVFMEAWIDAQVRHDERLLQAWENRQKDPKTFSKVVSKLGKQFGDRYSKLPDKAATEDREAVTEAVRGASSTASGSRKRPDYSGLSDAEFREAVSKEYGFTPL